MNKCKDCNEICDDRAIRCHSCANKILGKNQTGKKHPMYKDGKSRTKKYQKEYSKKYREEHKETIKIKSKIYTTKNKDIKKEYDKQYRLKNKIKRQKLQRKYKQEHKKERKIYRDNKFKTDIGFKIEHNLRGRIYSALKGKNKSKSTMKLIGCSIDFLKVYLEKQFTKGMSWKNYGKNGWEIDHIKPCCSFNLINNKEQLKCFNYKNLQPLWEEDNRKKHTKEI